MQLLTERDTMFLYLETANSPMHIGNVAIFEGGLNFDAFREILASRLHMVRTFRQRLVHVPFDLDYPYWIDDPDFDIDRHLHYISLPEPGGWEQLRDISIQFFSQPLNRTRPLWELIFIEGLDSIQQIPPDSIAIVSKIHHAAIDGVSGTDIMGIIYDSSPEVAQVPPPEPRYIDPLPGDVELLFRTWYNYVQRSLKIPKLVFKTAWSTIKAGQLAKVEGMGLPPLPFSAPPTLLNVPISSQRAWDNMLFSLDRVKNIRKKMPGSTINDVVLAVCGGGLRRYLEEKGGLPEKPLVSMVPISTRTETEKGSIGNQISLMLVQLATDEADPIKRLEKIYQNTIRSKTYHQATSAKILMDYTEFIPFSIGNLATHLYTRFSIAKRHDPVFNVVITNVPCSQTPFYMGGKQLLATMGIAPVFDGVGLILTIISYNDTMSISATSCAETVSDVELLIRYLGESLDELEQAVQTQPDMIDIETESLPISDIFFENIQQHLVNNPHEVDKQGGVYQLNIMGSFPQAWIIDVKTGRVTQGKSAKADCEMTISADTFMHIADGKLTFQQAYSERKLMITGSGVITSCLGIDVSTNSGLSFCAFLKQFAQNIIDDPFLTESIQNIYQLNVTTETNMMKSWVIDLKNRPPCLFEGELMEADCGITISAKDFMHIIEGDLDSETAFTERKMMVTGNLDMVMDFWQVLRESLKSSQMDIEDMPLNPEPESHSVSDEMDIEDMPLNPEPEPPSVSDEMDIEDMPLNPEPEPPSVSDEMDIEDMPLNPEQEVHSVSDEMDIEDMPLNPEQEVHSVSDEMDIEDMPLNAEPEVHSVSDEMDIKDMPLNPKPEVHSVSDEMDIEDMPLNAEPESELPSTIGQCKATTLAGNRCRNKIMDGSEYCHIHHRKIHGDEIMDEFNIPL